MILTRLFAGRRETIIFNLHIKMQKGRQRVTAKFYRKVSKKRKKKKRKREKKKPGISILLSTT